MAGTPGRSGRKPKPTALKKLEGNRGKRKIDDREEMKASGDPECPSWLEPEARDEWMRLLPELRATGVLAKIDRGALAACCTEWARFVAAEIEIAANGLVLVQIERVLEDGKLLISRAVKNPAVQISKEAQQHYRAWCSEFGLTPSARSRVKVPTKPGGADGSKPNPLRLVNGGRGSSSA